jgi:hypothetical protein
MEVTAAPVATVIGRVAKAMVSLSSVLALVTETGGMGLTIDLAKLGTLPVEMKTRHWIRSR